MTAISEFDSVLDVTYGRDPYLDAWLLHFMTENNLEYSMDPERNASPEQLGFMVCLKDAQVFAPCSDDMLKLLLNNWLDPDLQREYNARWRMFVKLVHAYVPSRPLRKTLYALCRHKFKLAKSSPIIIPSRLMKRFITIFMAVSGQQDPYREERILRNAMAWNAVKRPDIQKYINTCPNTELACSSISDMRFDLDMIELERLMMLAGEKRFWKEDGFSPTAENLNAALEANSERFRPVREYFSTDTNRNLKILYIPDTSGGLVLDLLLIREFLRQGHKVVLALKEGFYFNSPIFWDWDHDPVLMGQLRDAYFLSESRITKNELLRYQRENDFIVISDGTREELNLCRTSVTFARVWKEADLVVAKGAAHYRRLIDSSHSFTRDILCFYRNRNGELRLNLKVKPEFVHKFSEASLDAMARSIISSMRKAKAEGKSVMFYSAVVGSIPGQVKTALSLLEVFVGHLRERLDTTFIINPGEHFVEGMDADDLMYMWERVQRSGLIDVWRFQTVEDIEKSFELLGRTVPSYWAGKDATYSTGCTKEMRIALDVQKKNPEMQIIGPSPEKFFRRQEYGVGKFFDAALGSA